EISAAAAGRAIRVGVFQNQPREEVERIANEVPLDVVQLHGAESPDYAGALTFPVLKVLAGGESLEREAALFPGLELLIDHPSGGGSGKTWDFSLARPLVGRGRRVWIGGGLGPANVAAAIRAALPYGVDASSGLESAPGKKDHAKLRAFVAAARAAAPERTR